MVHVGGGVDSGGWLIQVGGSGGRGFQVGSGVQMRCG